MAYEHRIVREIEFHQTDMAGIMHFSQFLYLMEAAEHGFFRSLGISIDTKDPEPLGWPRVHVDCDFSYPLRFEDLVEVRLLVREKREKSIVYSFQFFKISGEPRREVARGTLAVACVKRDPATGAIKAVPIPEQIAGKIEPAPPEALGA
jgi:YbgC/YbaW family acyl-CoA thioester hydrolase